MFMKLLTEWLEEYSKRDDHFKWTWSDFENFATWLDNRSTQPSVQSDACPSCDGIGSMKLFGVITLNCSTCHGTGKRR